MKTKKEQTFKTKKKLRKVSEEQMFHDFFSKEIISTYKGELGIFASVIHAIDHRFDIGKRVFHDDTNEENLLSACTSFIIEKFNLPTVNASKNEMSLIVQYVCFLLFLLGKSTKYEQYSINRDELADLLEELIESV